MTVKFDFNAYAQKFAEEVAEKERLDAQQKLLSNTLAQELRQAAFVFKGAQGVTYDANIVKGWVVLTNSKGGVIRIFAYNEEDWTIKSQGGDEYKEYDADRVSKDEMMRKVTKFLIKY